MLVHVPSPASVVGPSDTSNATSINIDTDNADSQTITEQLALHQRGRWSPEHLLEEAYEIITQIYADNSSTPTPTPAAATTSVLQSSAAPIHKQISSESECHIHRAVNPLSSSSSLRRLLLWSCTSSMVLAVRYTLARATSEIPHALPWCNPGFPCRGGWWLGLAGGRL